jgi:PBP superfamily domain
MGRSWGYREEVSTHWAVALRILRGEADVGVATRAVAAALSLGFVPLARERFDLVIPKTRFFQPPIQALFGGVAMSWAQGESVRLHAAGSLRAAVHFQQDGTPAVQKHGTPGSWSLT